MTAVGLGTSNIGNLTITTGNAGTGNGITVNSISSYSITSTGNPARINVGSGKLGDWSGSGADASTNARNARVWVADEYIRTDNGQRVREFATTAWANLNGGNIGGANTNSRTGAGVFEQYIYNGNSVSTNPFYATGLGSALIVGTGANTGNATLAAGSSLQPFLSVNAGSSATNLGLLTGPVTHNGNIANLWCVSWQSSGSGNVTTNLATFYHPPAASANSITAVNLANSARSATNYHAFRNDDNLAKVRLGSIETGHYFTSNTAATSGTVTVDKTLGQYQFLYPSANVTGMTFTNFVTRVAKPDGTFLNQTDQVTLVIQQSDPVYDIALPSGNVNIKYAYGTNSLSMAANTTSTVVITAVFNNTTGNTQYLVDQSVNYASV